MTFFLGVLVGMLPTILHRIDMRLAEVGDECGPMETWWFDHVTRPITRRARRPGDAVHGWVLGRRPVAWVLALRPWRVTYESHCIYGGPPHGWEPYKAGESWHWTARGAERRRRRRPIGVRGGSSMIVTSVEKPAL